MLTNSLLILAGLTVASGVILIGYGAWLHHLSGFAFYSTAGLVAGLVTCGAAALLLSFPDWSDLIFFIGVLVIILPIKGLWEEAQERFSRKTRPSEWLVWEKTLTEKQALAGWLLYPIRRRNLPISKESKIHQK